MPWWAGKRGGLRALMECRDVPALQRRFAQSPSVSPSRLDALPLTNLSPRYAIRSVGFDGACAGVQNRPSVGGRSRGFVRRRLATVELLCTGLVIAAISDNVIEAVVALAAGRQASSSAADRVWPGLGDRGDASGSGGLAVRRPRSRVTGEGCSANHRLPVLRVGDLHHDRLRSLLAGWRRGRPFAGRNCAGCDQPGRDALLSYAQTCGRELGSLSAVADSKQT